MKNITFIFIVLLFSACSVFQPANATKEKVETDKSVDEVYVFDDLPEDTAKADEISELEKEIDKTKAEKNTTEEKDVFDESVKSNSQKKSIKSNKFYLQLGAFSTLKRAELFTEEIKIQVPFNLSIIYNSDTSLYTVRSSAFSSRKAVESERENLWKRNLFKDSFIVTE